LPDLDNSIEIAWPEDVVDLAEPYQFTPFPTLPLELRRQIVSSSFFNCLPLLMAIEVLLYDYALGLGPQFLLKA
jgi:hypothetical protein